MKIRAGLLAVLALGTAPAYAALQEVSVTNPTVWATTGSNVIRVITPNVNVVNADGCSDPDSYMVLQTLPRDAQMRIYALLLTAKVNSKSMTLRVSGCESNRPAIIDAYF
ncbi:hypothetical protein [Cognatilysobacter terrigena]|uniref:hypothetical protein n=1 Tax=Cognatilysobacter terrigena TaxID=2488749 RepID=UPI0014151278|nr:hypothetical protein [Lysobacter terrigena]